ncbi:MAG TPA: hypothetical protein VFW96_02135 [Thermomicrobiales bacterium]|nr:hypothetical protein [Thermomicrobiales bacterium]
MVRLVPSARLGILCGFLLCLAPALTPGLAGAPVARAAGPVTTVSNADSKWAAVTDYPREGRLYALFAQTSGPNFTLRLEYSADSGRTWTNAGAFPAAEAGRAPDYPTLAVDSTGLMHAIWCDIYGDGKVYHGLFWPGGGKSPANIGNWQVERIDAGTGKNPGLAFDRATRDLYAVWDTNGGIAGRRWSPGGGWGPIANLGAGGLPGVAATPDGHVHVVRADPGRNVVYDEYDRNWGYVGGSHRVLSTNQANHWPQIVGEPSSAVDVVWSQVSPPAGGRWEIYYARRTTDGRWNGGGPPQRVSRNLAGSLDRWPTIQLGADGVPWVAWQGDDAGPVGYAQVYERRRAPGNDPWPDYRDPAAYCVSCASGGDAESARYGFSANGDVVQLTFLQESRPGVRQWGVRYTLRAAGGGPTSQQPPPPAAPPAPVPPAPAGWGDWVSLGGTLADAPAAASLGGRAYVFVRGADNRLYTRWTSDGGATFSPWQDLGGALTAAPAATSFGGRLYVFVRGGDNGLYLARSNPDGNFTSGWEALGGVLTGPPAAASSPAGVYVFVRGGDDGLYFRRAPTGAWFGQWNGLGGTLATAPGAAGFENGVTVFVTGGGGALYKRRTLGPDSFDGWAWLGGALTSAPAAAAYTPYGSAPTLTVFGAGGGGALYARRTTDSVTYGPWQALGGILVGPPAAAGQGAHLFVFARGTDNALWVRRTR